MVIWVASQGSSTPKIFVLRRQEELHFTQLVDDDDDDVFVKHILLSISLYISTSCRNRAFDEIYDHIRLFLYCIVSSRPFAFRLSLFLLYLLSACSHRIFCSLRRDNYPREPPGLPFCHECTPITSESHSSCLFTLAVVRYCGCLVQYLVTLYGFTITSMWAGWPHADFQHNMEIIGGRVGNQTKVGLAGSGWGRGDTF
jgi:hypothetical protein